MTTSSSSPESKRRRRSWIDLINESVHASDDIDIGDIDAVSRDFIVVKRGYVNVHYYYIPISKVEGWDSQVLWLKINEDEVKSKYQRDIVPDPSRYYIKDYPYYNAAYYPEVVIIQPRYKRPVFTTPPTAEMPRIYSCDLCNIPSFKDEEELSKHVAERH